MDHVHRCAVKTEGPLKNQRSSGICGEPQHNWFQLRRSAEPTANEYHDLLHDHGDALSRRGKIAQLEHALKDLETQALCPKLRHCLGLLVAC